MAPTLSVPVRNDLADRLNTLFGNGILELRTGTRPAVGAAPVGTVIVSITLPATPFAAAANGAVAKNGTWNDPSADASGTPTWARMRQATDAGTTNTTDERMDFNVGQGSGDISLNNTTIVAGQDVTINTFGITVPEGTA